VAKNPKETNVVEMIEAAPDGLNVSREAWAKTPDVVRSEIIRAHTELNERLPIWKDRAARRKSRSVGGFYEMHCCERDGSPAKLARAAELKELLAPEQALFDRAEGFAEFHDMAERQGKRLADVLRAYVAMEDLIRRDPIEGIRRIAANAGIDLEAWAQRVLESDVA
jgi:hypothetical protein